MLVQLGLLDKAALPVSGAEQTARLIDPKLPSNTLILRSGGSHRKALATCWWWPRSSSPSCLRLRINRRTDCSALNQKDTGCSASIAYVGLGDRGRCLLRARRPAETAKASRRPGERSSWSGASSTAGARSKRSCRPAARPAGLSIRASPASPARIGRCPCLAPSLRHRSLSAAARVRDGTGTDLGVLFLDELPEFARRSSNALRSRSSGRPFDARQSPVSHCRIRPRREPGKCLGMAARATAHLGPLLDRIDLQIEVPAVSAARSRAAGDEGAEVRRPRRTLRGDSG